MKARAKWLDDGFLHPTAQVDREFVDVDLFVRVPVEGLRDMAQFSRIRVIDGNRARDCVVVGAKGLPSKALLSRVLGERYPGVVPVFVKSAEHGRVLLDAHELDELDAIAAAITNYRCAWDESAEIRVVGENCTISVNVTFDSDSDRYDVLTTVHPYRPCT
jgi:hypothetical protein